MKYTITADGLDTLTRSDKGAAVALADDLRKEHKTEVHVSTEKGKEVYVTKPRKAQTRTQAFTRVDSREYKDKLGEGVHLPRNYEVAYLRPRSSYALLRKVTQDSVSYLVFNLATGESESVDNTREGGARMRELRKAELELVA